ncbi:uncharacterized protein LOC130134614 [Syzygium oleosum]|uniref:uncharacterized protein LOC130134614 n=1 Tax=Syzygium oleosum TaxID=219896 RepID=UPI0024B9B7D8|nr:uncharacterized protein LOC130134614 [Syzygium oleosum]
MKLAVLVNHPSSITCLFCLHGSFWRQSAKTHRQRRAVMLLDLWCSGSPKFVRLFQVNPSGLAVSHRDMKHHFQVVAEMWWSQWLVLAVTGIQLDWRSGLVEVSLTVTVNFWP